MQVSATHQTEGKPAGGLDGQLAVIPAAAKAILIQAIYSFEPARVVRLSLAEAGIRRSERAIMIWLKTVRLWLGFPAHYPCCSSERYRALVARCKELNGTPSAEQIAAGWQPVSG